MTLTLASFLTTCRTIGLAVRNVGETFSSTDNFLSCLPRLQRLKSTCAALILRADGKGLYGELMLILGPLRSKRMLKFIVATARLALDRRGDSEHVSGKSV